MILREKGWDAALKQLSPDRNSTPKNQTTIGSFIDIVRPLASVRPRTFEIYAYALRKIAREATGAKDTSRSGFDPKGLGWRQATDLLLLSKLTPNAVAQWKAKVLAEATQNPVARQRARRNVNSFVRNARALFSRKILKRLKAKDIVLPSPLAFEGFEFEEQGNTKYDSKIDATALLQNARSELAETDAEEWKVILLALGAGLRRSEIDGLCWSQLDAVRGEIRIVNHEYFQAKTDGSEGKIFVDPGLMAELGRFQIEPDTTPVVDGNIPFRQSSGRQYYRCQETFERVTSWLRNHGVTGDKPLHTLRKEFGSIICAAADIHTASRQLRHSNLATTAAFYADHRRRVSVPVTEMLTAPEASKASTHPPPDENRVV
jgi:integrase